MSILGIDVGATSIKSGVVDAQGKIKDFRKTKNCSMEGGNFLFSHNASPLDLSAQAERGEGCVLKQLAGIINDYKEIFPIKKAGIGFAGSVNFKRGIVLSTANMGGIKNLYLKRELEKECNIEIIVDNDTHCFALAEAHFGAGRNYNDILCVTLGTGIGGGIIINKKLYRGADNTAGKIGHIIIDKNSDIKCGCGGFGHWESFTSGKALANLYKTATEQDVDAEIIAEMAGRGERIAQKVIIEAGYNFAIGIVNLLNILNPEIVIIGGSLIKIDLLWNTFLNNLPAFLEGKAVANTKIVKSKFGDEAGVIGASLLSR